MPHIRTAQELKLYAGSGIDQGRKAAKEALEAYSRGDKTKQAEMILEQDGLAMLEPDDVLKTCSQKYEDADLILRASRLMESQQLQQAGPAQPELQKQQGQPQANEDRPQPDFC